HLWYHFGTNSTLGAFMLTSTLQATTLALSDQGFLVASFAGLGVNSFNGTSYNQLSAFEASDLAFSAVGTQGAGGSYYDLVSAFNGIGLWEQRVSWQQGPAPRPTSAWSLFAPDQADRVVL